MNLIDFIDILALSIMLIGSCFLFVYTTMVCCGNLVVRGPFVAYNVHVINNKYVLNEIHMTENDKCLFDCDKSVKLKDIVNRKSEIIHSPNPEIIGKTNLYVIFFNYSRDYPLYMSSKYTGKNTHKINDWNYEFYSSIYEYKNNQIVDVIIYKINDKYPNSYYKCKTHEIIGNAIISSNI